MLAKSKLPCQYLPMASEFPDTSDRGIDQIDRIRDFNRDYTRRIGLLELQSLDSGLGLTEARLLRDIGEGEHGQTARVLADSLGLDEGYVSRLIGRFERAGWVSRKQDPNDGRRRILELTESGQTVLDPIRSLARTAIRERTEGLTATERDDLLAAMERIDQLFTRDRPQQTAVRLRDLETGDAGWIIRQHARDYAEEFGYDRRFETVVTRIMADFLEHHDPSVERGWIAETPEGTPVGCIFCVRDTDAVARLRLLYVDPACRGMGLGDRLVSTCLSFARQRTYAAMTLWTHKTLSAACALYARHGFRIVEEQPTRAFGRDVVDQTWEIRF